MKSQPAQIGVMAKDHEALLVKFAEFIEALKTGGIPSLMFEPADPWDKSRVKLSFLGKRYILCARAGISDKASVVTAPYFECWEEDVSTGSYRPGKKMFRGQRRNRDKSGLRKVHFCYSEWVRIYFRGSGVQLDRFYKDALESGRVFEGVPRAALVWKTIMPRAPGKEWKAVQVSGMVCLYCSLLCCAHLEPFPGQSRGSRQRHDCGGIMRLTHFRHHRRSVVPPLIWTGWKPTVKEPAPP